VSNHAVESGLLVKTSLFLVAAMILAQAGIAQECRRERPARAPAPETLPHPSDANRHIAPPGVKHVQVPFASLKPEAIFKIGENADWVQITDDAVWVASSKPPSVHRIDPKTNKEVAVIPLPGDPCAGLALDNPPRLRLSTHMPAGSAPFFPLDRPDRKAELRPALTASGSSAMTLVPWSESILLRTMSGREFPSRQVLTIHASVKAQCGSLVERQIC
jgi:hypothetical protein